MTNDEIKQVIRGFIEENQVICSLMCQFYIQKHKLIEGKIDKKLYYALHDEVEQEFKDKLSESDYNAYKNREFTVSLG